MLSLFTIAFLIVSTNSCSPPFPQSGQLYISNVQLLSETLYPHSVLLTIYRTPSYSYTQKVNSFNTAPWCKIMNINDASVGETVSCTDYSKVTRPYAQPDINPISTSVSCKDNCDGATATCIIIRNTITYTIDTIPYVSSINDCTNASPYILSMSSSFTINDTTYISFASNLVGIKFDDSTKPSTYTVYDVERAGDWSYLIPGYWGMDMYSAPSIYSNVKIMRIALPCCICYASRLVRYDITSDTVHKKQVFTLNALGFGGGNVDSIQQRVYNAGLFYTESVTVYDLSNGGIADVLRPGLCDVTVKCLVSPCSVRGLSCPYNVNARCVEDYCGGCNARWVCGSTDITEYCHSGLTSNQICWNEPIRITSLSNDAKTTVL